MPTPRCVAHLRSSPLLSTALFLLQLCLALLLYHRHHHSLPFFATGGGSSSNSQRSYHRPKLRTVAVCLNAFRTSEDYMENIQQHLVLPLNADLFVHYTYAPGKPPLSTSVFSLRCANFTAEPMLPAAELTRLLDHSPAARTYRTTIRNNALAPAYKRAGGGLWQYVSQHACLRLIGGFEERQRGGVRYERIIWSRGDFWWVHDHPPLELLNPAFIWIPTTEDYNGVNDRHAVCNRTVAEIYLGRWQTILEGTAVSFLRRHSDSESFLLARLNHYRVPIARFAQVAALSCCNHEENCYKWWRPVCTESLDPYAKRTFAYKYYWEGFHALKHSKILVENGNNWTSLLEFPNMTRQLRGT